MLRRVAGILDAVEAQPLTASAIAEKTKLSISTAHRLAVDMADFGFLARGEDGRFSLGTRFRVSPLEVAAKPILSQLRDLTGESAQIWVRRGNVRLCLITEDSRHELRATRPVGSRLDLPAGSSGRILAGGDDVDEELAEHGWIESVSQRTPGLCSVSAPIIVRDQLLGALCLAAPVSRSGEQPGERYGADVLKAARDIEEAAANFL